MKKIELPKFRTPRPNIQAEQTSCLLANINTIEDLIGDSLPDDEIIWKDNPFDVNPEEIRKSSDSQDWTEKFHLIP